MNIKDPYRAQANSNPDDFDDEDDIDDVDEGTDPVKNTISYNKHQSSQNNRD